MEPKIIFEDNEILVLEKPAGMVVNRAESVKGETVQEWVEKYLKVPQVVQVSRVPQGEETRDTRGTLEPRDTFFQRVGIVHRLDKETSGLLLVAKTPEAFADLQRQFKERKVKKVYTALVHGKVEPREGEIVVPVGRLPWNRKRFGIVAGGREAVTKYKVLSIMYQVLNKNKEQLTLLELYPETGRTHQIRVHLKYFGHPVFGDPLYAGRKTARNDRKILSRLFLHASKISFFHPSYAKASEGKPKTEEIVSFESPLPEELEKFLTDTRSPATCCK